MATTKKITSIKYTARDFNSIKSELVEYAKRYYPDTFKDFNEASFGSFILDTVAYVGDSLSFYADYSANESHLKTSIEFNNILKHGYKLGYKYNPYASSYGTVTIYCIVPANMSGLGPNLKYAPILKKGTTFFAGNNIFSLIENVSMNDPSFSIRVAKTDPTTGTPTHYAIKGYGSVVSGTYKLQQSSLGAFTRFRKVEINSSNVADVQSVFDSEGNEYFEVDYLSQNIVYKEIPNTQSDSALAPNILVPVACPRRYVVERTETSTYLVFGASDNIEVENDLMLEDPTKLVLDMQGRQFITDESFDPKRLINSDKFGVAPSNTTLTITYRTNDTDNVNASVGSINSIDSLLVEFVDERTLNTTYVDEVRDSFIVENEEPVVGSVTLPNSDELKRRILDTFSTQNRAVTEKDYEASCYSMPSKFGAIKRAKVVKDSDSFKRNLNLYILSEDEQGHLTNPSVNIKKNLKTWLDKNKMISDTIDIIDAKIVNLSIEFTALGVNGKSKSDVLDDSMKALTKYFSRIPEIGEPFMINEVLAVLKKVDSVLDVKDVRIKRKTGSDYATTGLNIDSSLTSIKSNRIIEMPLNVIWEIKYPESDIRGIIL